MTMPRRYVALALLLLLAATGCTTWGSHPSPQPSSSQRLPNSVRVVRMDQTTVLLANASVSGDSIVGTADGQRTAVALADVQTVQARKTNFVATVALTAVVALTLIVVALTSSGVPSY